MNIGIVTTWFERGAAYVSRAYMDALSGEHNVYIYARGGEMQAKGDPAWNLPNVTWAPRLGGPLSVKTNGMSRLHFLRWLAKHHIHIILFNEQQYTDIVREVASLGYVTGAYIDYYTRNTVRDFDVYDFLICNTRRHYSIFKKHRNCLFLQWGTNIDLFRPDARRPLSANSIVFFHSAGMGGVSNRKGTDLLVLAFQQVTGNARLLIHSQVPMKQYGDDIVSLIRNDSRIEFIERSVHAPGLYHLGDVYVYPSRLEGIGLTIPEALASGLPVITTDEMPMNEFVEDHYNGLLVEVLAKHRRDDGYYWDESTVSIHDLAQKMQAYVDDRQLISEHSSNARVSAERLYNWTQNSAGLSDWFAQLSVGQTVDNAGIWKSVKWLLLDLGLAASSCISGIVRAFVPSKRVRGWLKRALGLS